MSYKTFIPLESMKAFLPDSEIQSNQINQLAQINNSQDSSFKDHPHNEASTLRKDLELNLRHDFGAS